MTWDGANSFEGSAEQRGMIDLRSDSLTEPTARMREAAAAAETGHDGYGGDPTVRELESVIVERTGMDAAIYLPSGTMANLVAVLTHTEPGDEVVLEAESHLYTMEVAGIARIGNVLARPIDGGERGVITAEQVREAYSGSDITHLFDRTPTGLLALENTHNARGGTAISPADIEAPSAAARELGVPVHLDGARLFRAAAAHGCDIGAYTRVVDSVYIDFAKIGAPFGVGLAGDAAFIESARRYRQLLGGHMKQAGIVAAPALVALDESDRLGDDAEKAARLAAELSSVDSLSVPSPETNILYVDVSETGLTALAFVDACEQRGVLTEAFGDGVVRFVTHRDVSLAEVSDAADSIAAVATA